MGITLEVIDNTKFVAGDVRYTSYKAGVSYILTFDEVTLREVQLTKKDRKFINKCIIPGAPLSKVLLGLELLTRRIEEQSTIK